MIKANFISGYIYIQILKQTQHKSSQPFTITKKNKFKKHHKTLTCCYKSDKFNNKEINQVILKYTDFHLRKEMKVAIVIVNSI